MQQTTSNAEKTPQERRPHTPGRRWLRGLLQVGLGLALGLGLAELVFRWRDQGAFPHLNTYLADARLGVRLRPGASMALRFGSPSNPLTRVTIGPEGYREPLPAPSPGDILVVGDSQVFGLGVEVGETFSRVLQDTLKAEDGQPAAQVLNLGVPTYGPDEYLAVLEEALQTRKPRAVVLTVNMVNDLFEASRPNIERHGVLDGWAVRKENMPGTLWPLPFRDVVLGRSHLVYALRTYLERERLDSESVPATASEGSYEDLLDVASQTSEAERAAQLAFTTGSRAHSVEENAAYLELAHLDAQLDRVLRAEVACEGVVRYDYETDGSQAPGTREKFPCAELGRAPKLGEAVVLDPYAEESRSVRVTADHLRRAAWLRAYRDENAKAIAEVEVLPAVKAAAQRRNAARDRYVALRGERPRYRPPSTPLSPALGRLAELGKRHGTRVVVLVLPIDVAVSPAEWAKYGETTPIDMSAANAFAKAITDSSHALGLEALDATPLLAAAEPGAFLDGDIHMTPKGHRAVAAGLAQLLAAPPAPTESEADQARAQAIGVTYAGLRKDYALSHAGCVGFPSQERFTLACPLTKLESLLGRAVGGGNALDGVSIPSHDSSQVLVGSVGDIALVHASLERAWELVLHHGERQRTVLVQENNLRPDVVSHPLAVSTPPAFPLAASDARFLACAQQRPNDDLGPADADCIRTYAQSCELMLACSRGAEYAPPSCQDGHVSIPPYGRCAPLCVAGDAASCGTPTRCTAHAGLHVCLVPALSGGGPKPVP